MAKKRKGAYCAHLRGLDALGELVDGLREEALVFDDVATDRSVADLAEDEVPAAFEGHCERCAVDGYECGEDLGGRLTDWRPRNGIYALSGRFLAKRADGICRKAIEYGLIVRRHC